MAFLGIESTGHHVLTLGKTIIPLLGFFAGALAVLWEEHPETEISQNRHTAFEIFISKLCTWLCLILLLLLFRSSFLKLFYLVLFSH